MTRANTSAPTSPEFYLGVYKQLSDVPERYRLENFEAEYAGRDVWEEFLDAVVLDESTAERHEQDIRRYGRRWKEHCEEADVHHALATPTDVDNWCEKLLYRFSLRTAYTHWKTIERFYTWLQSHTEHPHVYHPPWLAAANYEASGKIWKMKLKRRIEARGGEP